MTECPALVITNVFSVLSTQLSHPETKADERSVRRPTGWVAFLCLLQPALILPPTAPGCTQLGAAEITQGPDFSVIGRIALRILKIF